MKSVVIIQTILTHYRIPLFNHIKIRLSEHGIRLRVIHGRRDSGDLQQDEGILEWAETVQNRTVKFPKGIILWQSIRVKTKGCDLVIMPQHNRLLANWLLMAFPGSRKTALWGHGKNFQETSAIKAILRKKMAVLPDWWFAYTDSAREAIETTGFNKDSITVLQNAVDTESLRNLINGITQKEINQLKSKLRLNGNLCVFCSSLHQGKRIDFLLQTAELIRLIVPDFELLIIGDGPEKKIVDQFCNKNSWIRSVGVKFGREKALHLLCGQVFLMPYFVGLSILDAFCAGLPIVVVKDGNHSPEISYLKEGINGLSSRSEVENYAQTTANLLLDKERLKRMQDAAKQDSLLYTIEKMADRFTNGILQCLSKID